MVVVLAYCKALSSLEAFSVMSVVMKLLRLVVGGSSSMSMAKRVCKNDRENGCIFRC